MRIAIDFDDTVTKDPVLWNFFISQAKARGHDIIIVTMRDVAHSARVYETVKGLDKDKIFFTALHGKRDFMLRKGIAVDVWVDDNPEAVIANHPALADPTLRWMDEDQFNSGACTQIKE